MESEAEYAVLAVYNGEMCIKYAQQHQRACLFN
jgi:hypothetical protein